MTKHTELRAASAQRRTDAAIAALAQGFKSEANRKAANADIARAFDDLTSNLRDELIAAYPTRNEDEAVGVEFNALYWHLPAGAHVWNAKAAARFAAFPDYCAKVEALAALRVEIKAAPIEPKPVREDHPLLVEARKNAPSFAELNAKRGEQYRDALNIGRVFKGLPVSVNRIFCVNYAGTQWMRLDWFLNDRRVPFSVIAAAHDQLVREGVIKEEAAA
jgi:hypothetical protein